MSDATPLPPQEAPPVCPRHPDQVSYVRCQRCLRPTCPQCQRAALGAKALCPISPIALPYKLDAVATKGAGRVGVKVYSRAK